MDLITTLIVASFFFVMGALVMGLIWYLQNLSRKIRNRAKGASPQDPNLTELACLMRDMQSQELVVQMDGKAFRGAQELSPAQQRRLNFTSNVLNKWLAQSTPPSMPAEQQAETPEETAEAEPMPVPLPVPELTEPVEPRPGYVPPFAPEEEPEVKPISTDLPDVVGNLLTPAPAPAMQFKSIAMQINDILQARLIGTPLESRGITVSDAPDHGAQFTLDGQKYAGVKDVPDEEVRNAIRAAVQEWETKK